MNDELCDEEISLMMLKKKIIKKKKYDFTNFEDLNKSLNVKITVILKQNFE